MDLNPHKGHLWRATYDTNGDGELQAKVVTQRKAIVDTMDVLDAILPPKATVTGIQHLGEVHWGSPVNVPVGEDPQQGLPA